MIQTRPGQEKRIFSVSELTRDIKILLEDNFSEVWVEGEISNLSLPSSGHVYFTLKDENAQLKSVIFRNVNSSLRFKLEDGMKVVCFGRIGVYEKSGQYQLYVEKLEPKGIGALQMAFQQLKEKLYKEGLFDPARKKPIPVLPQRIGVVTSPTGAAIRDILNILKRRFSNVEIIINPVKVQGDGAAAEIANAIMEMNIFGNIDVMIVGRGGGSLEDLWAFNEEVVARAIYASKIPVISAVGHEIDWTIADFVADLRAPTPSAAAELVIINKEDILERIAALNERLRNSLVGKVNLLRRQLRQASESYVLRRPGEFILEYQQRVDDLVKETDIRMRHIIQMCQQRLSSVCGKLGVLNPFAVLSRGFSVSMKLPGDVILRSSAELAPGDRVRTKLSHGEFTSRVEALTVE
jgi:exodeoxyribonuclease VII large subunit